MSARRTLSTMSSSITKKPRLTHRQPADITLLPTPTLNFSGNADFIESCEKDIIQALESSVSSVISTQNLTYATTTLRLSTALARASLLSSQCAFPALVSGSALARERSSESKKIFRSVFDRVFSNRSLFEKLKSVENLLSPEQARINQELCQQFERRGVGLASSSDRDKVAVLSSKIGELEGIFEQAINEDTTVLNVEDDELSGCPTSFIASLDLLEDGKRALTMKAPHTVPVAKHCVREDTRQRLQMASQTRCLSNESLLEELVSKRQERAQLLGWKDHASFMLSAKMAETPERVMSFMETISTRLQEVKDQDMKSLLEIAEKENIETWNYNFYARKLKEQLHSLDDEVIREYFPLDHVLIEILSMYETLLDVEFRQFEEGAPAGWHEDVQAFAVLDASSQELVGHFYLDLFSRPGKFGHQCVVPLAPSFVEILPAGEGGEGGVQERRRQLPACAILGNMTKPNVTTSRPSLLTFSEVKTFFHEFGHVMHAVLTKVDHSIHSWTWPMMPWVGGVQQDYLEVPSMMLEQFVYRPQVLARLSSHYETGATLDIATMQSLAGAKHFLAGLSYKRFLAFAVFDMIIHQQGSVPFSFQGKTGLTYRDLWSLCQTTYWGFEPQVGTHYYTTWYHMAIGYDAGYYGYLWSEVYACDVLSKFPDDLEWQELKEVGKKYRTTMLEPGGSLSGGDMLFNFLGRAPNDKAFVDELFTKAKE